MGGLTGEEIVTEEQLVEGFEIIDRALEIADEAYEG